MIVEILRIELERKSSLILLLLFWYNAEECVRYDEMGLIVWWGRRMGQIRANIEEIGGGFLITVL